MRGTVMVLIGGLLWWLRAFSDVNATKAKLNPANVIKCEEDGYEDCSCPENPITERYADVTDKTCEHYYMCHKGRAFLSKCDIRTAFLDELKQCVPRDRIPESVCEFPVRCDKTGYQEDPEDCNKYYLCIRHLPHHYSCKENYYFSPMDQKCIFDKEMTEACTQDNYVRSRIKPYGHQDPRALIATALDRAQKYLKRPKDDS